MTEDTIKKEDSPYGFEKNPPYSLYQTEDGRWGLIDASGKRLEAVFKRADDDKNLFSRNPWEVVSFDSQEGFSLVAWYDPCEVWFNFTFDNPAYPAEYAELLWKKQEKEIEEYREILYKHIPTENDWLINEILQEKELAKKEDEDFDDAVDALLSKCPQILKPSITNPMLEPIMSNPEIDRDIKIALWRAKVYLDYHILSYFNSIPEEE